MWLCDCGSFYLFWVMNVVLMDFDVDKEFEKDSLEVGERENICII